MTESPAAIRWLLESDPAIRWQAMRDLTGAPADQIAAERARVATSGLGARFAFPAWWHYDVLRCFFKFSGCP